MLALYDAFKYGLSLLFLYFNGKVLPFAWTIKFYYLMSKQLFLPRIFNSNSTDEKKKIKKNVFESRTYKTYCALLECDVYLHKSNSTYFNDLDLARTDAFTWVFNKGLNRFAQDPVAVKSLLERISKTDVITNNGSDITNNSSDVINDKTGITNDKENITNKIKPNGNSKQIKTTLFAGYPYIALGNVGCKFRKEIQPLAKYYIQTRVLGWDDKWIKFISKFVLLVKDKNGKQMEKLAAIAISEYVVKLGRITIPPPEFVKMCNLWDENVEKRARNDFKLSDKILSGEITEVDFPPLI